MHIKECLCTCRVVEIDKTDKGAFFVKCPSCGIRGPIRDNIESAVHGWNLLIKRPMYVNRYPQIPGTYFYRNAQITTQLRYYSARKIENLRKLGRMPGKCEYWSDEPVLYPHVYSSTV